MTGVQTCALPICKTTTVMRRRALPPPNQFTRGEMSWPEVGPEARKGRAAIGWGASNSALHTPMPAAMANMASDCVIRGPWFGHAARAVKREDMNLKQSWLRIKSFLKKDRKSVVKGKSVSVRVDLGGRRNIKNKIKKHKTQ